MAIEALAISRRTKEGPRGFHNSGSPEMMVGLLSKLLCERGRDLDEIVVSVRSGVGQCCSSAVAD